MAWQPPQQPPQQPSQQQPPQQQQPHHPPQHFHHHHYHPRHDHHRRRQPQFQLPQYFVPPSSTPSGHRVTFAHTVSPWDGGPLNLNLAIPSDDGGLALSVMSHHLARRIENARAITDDLFAQVTRLHSAEAQTAMPGAAAGSNRPSSFASNATPHNPLIETSLECRRGPALVPHPSSLDIPEQYGGNAIFDMYALSYVAEPDSSLLCPICHDPLVDPVTTLCDHTFCYRCLRQSLVASPAGGMCPIDRNELSWKDCANASRLIRTQLNALLVRCPHHSRGCTKEMRREVVELHATTECGFAEANCPDDNCGKKLRNVPTTHQCLHRTDACGYCFGAIEEADREMHLLSCPKTMTRCDACWLMVFRDQMQNHQAVECEALEVACPYKSDGCSVQGQRGLMAGHSASCPFNPETPSGAIIRCQRELVLDLVAQVRDLNTRQDDTTRRLDELTMLVSDGGMHRQHPNSPFGDPRAVPAVDAGFEEVHQNLTQLEARQSMWTLNQVMPLREEVTELRNNTSMLRMQMNGLLGRLRDLRPSASGNGASSPAGEALQEGGPSVTVVNSSIETMDMPRL